MEFRRDKDDEYGPIVEEWIDDATLKIWDRFGERVKFDYEEARWVRDMITEWLNERK